MVLSDGQKSFQIGLAVLIQYRSVTASHSASQPRCRSKYRAYAQVKHIEAEITKFGTHMCTCPDVAMILGPVGQKGKVTGLESVLLSLHV